MARSSLGTDVFSPVRFDLSFDENIINAEVKSDRGSISETLRRPSTQRLIENFKSVASLEKDSRRKIDSLSEENVLKRSKKSNQNGNTAIEEVTTKCQSPLPNSHKILNSPNTQINRPSTLPVNDEVLKKSRSRRSKDGKGDREIKKKDKSSRSSESIHSSGTKNMSTDVLSSKFVTVRQERKKNSFADSVDILPVHSERNEEKASVTENLKDCNKSIQPDLSTSEKEIASTKMGPIVELDSLNQMKPEETRTATNKILSEKHPTDNGSSSVPSIPNQSAQVQRNIIEKLISDTVSYEFDGIRRQMYLQQISILKMLNQRMDEFEIQHTNTTQALHEIIADLLEENRKLKNALIARQ